MEGDLVYVCANCTSLCENERRHSIQLSSTENCNSIFTELEIVDALSYIYGFSWQELTLKAGLYGAVAESQVSIGFCEGCAFLLEENYKAHQNFQNASHIESIVYQIKNYRTHNQSLLENVKTEAMEEGFFEYPYSGDDLFPDVNLDNNLQTSVSPVFEKSVDVKCEPSSPTQNDSKFRRNHQLSKQKQPVLNIERLSETDISSFCTNWMQRGSRKSSRIANTRNMKDSQNISAVDALKLFPSQIKQENDEHLDHLDFDAEPSMEDKPIEIGRSKKKKSIVLSEIKKAGRNRVARGGRYHKCKLCDHSTTNRYYLARHVRRIHDEGFRICCEICGKKYSNIRRHMLRHAGEKKKCTVCGKEVAELTVHMRNKHSSAKQTFPCSQCDRTYSSKWALQTHQDFHTNGKVQCETCGKLFTSKFVLTEHEKTHSEFKPFPCSECPKMFRSKVELKSHSFSHAGRDFVCDECGKTFKSPKHLKTHLRGHKEMEERGERSFACPKCPKLFNTRCNLYNHDTRCHRNPKVLQCRFCGKILAGSGPTYNLRLHESRHIKLGHVMQFGQHQQEELESPP